MLIVVALCLSLVSTVLLIGTIRDGYLAYTKQVPSWDVAWAAWTVVGPIVFVVVACLMISAGFLVRTALRRHPV